MECSEEYARRCEQLMKDMFGWTDEHGVHTPPLPEYAHLHNSRAADPFADLPPVPHKPAPPYTLTRRGQLWDWVDADGVIVGHFLYDRTASDVLETYNEAHRLLDKLAQTPDDELEEIGWWAKHEWQRFLNE